MSTPLIFLAAILAIFAVILIPLMMMKGAPQESREPAHDPGHHGKRVKKRKKR